MLPLPLLDGEVDCDMLQPETTRASRARNKNAAPCRTRGGFIFVLITNNYLDKGTALVESVNACLTRNRYYYFSK